jgi:ribonuclease BN (tRNA processing enzyme)
MKIVFLGVGEAFDENNSNNSSLVVSKGAKFLLDCGATAPFELWKYNNDQNLLDAIYISHTHADHYFGLPSLLVRMWEEKRTKPLTIICQKGLKKDIKQIMKLGYDGSAYLFKFKLNFIEVKPGQVIKFRDLKLSFAPTKHSKKNLAIKVSNEKKSICYSGDGTFTKKTEELYKDSDLVIHEAYLYDKKTIGHGQIKDLIKMAERNNIKCLALTHINRELRKKLNRKKISSKKVKIIIPKGRDRIQI